MKKKKSLHDIILITLVCIASIVACFTTELVIDGNKIATIMWSVCWTFLILFAIANRIWEQFP